MPGGLLPGEALSILQKQVVLALGELGVGAEGVLLGVLVY